MKNIKLLIAYDGTNYLGWQKTQMGLSIEETLEKTLSQILQEVVHLQAASRTDKGVHAENQVVNFFTERAVNLNTLQHSLNSLLPKDIAVKSAEIVPINFHPTLDCKEKEYHYLVCNGFNVSPMQRFYMWHYPHPLNLTVMEEAAQILIGEHDFQAFTNAKKNETYESYIRVVKSIKIIQMEDSCLRFEICGTNFLYKMVRNIVGSLVYTGCNKLSIQNLKSILEMKKRDASFVTAPAIGLKLYKINY